MIQQTVRTKVPLIQELSSVRQWTPEEISPDEEKPLIEEVKDKPPILTPFSCASSSPFLTEISTKHFKEKSSKTETIKKDKKEPQYTLDLIKTSKMCSKIVIEVKLPDVVSKN